MARRRRARPVSPGEAVGTPSGAPHDAELIDPLRIASEGLEEVQDAGKQVRADGGSEAQVPDPLAVLSLAIEHGDGYEEDAAAPRRRLLGRRSRTRGTGEAARHSSGPGVSPDAPGTPARADEPEPRVTTWAEDFAEQPWATGEWPAVTELTAGDLLGAAGNDAGADAVTEPGARRAGGRRRRRKGDGPTAEPIEAHLDDATPEPAAQTVTEEPADFLGSYLHVPPADTGNAALGPSEPVDHVVEDPSWDMGVDGGSPPADFLTAFLAPEGWPDEATEHERLAAESAERRRLDGERDEAELAERARLAAQRAEDERLAAEGGRRSAFHAEQARLEAEALEAERIEAERAAAQHAEDLRLDQVRRAALEAEDRRLAAEHAEAERIETERAAAQHAEDLRLDEIRHEAERAAAERRRLEAVRAAAVQTEHDRLAAIRLEAERLAAESAEHARLDAEMAERQRIAAEQAEADRLAAERAAAEHAEAERLTGLEERERRRQAAFREQQERIAAQRAEKERIAAERAEWERQARERTAKAAAPQAPGRAGTGTSGGPAAAPAATSTTPEIPPVIAPAVRPEAPSEARTNDRETEGSPVPRFVEFRSGNALNYVFGALFVVFAAGAVIAIFWAVSEGSRDAVLGAAGLTALAMASWWALLSWSPPVVSISNGLLEVTRGSSTLSWDLRDPTTDVDLRGRRSSAAWKAVLRSDAGKTVTISARQVDAAQFTEIVEHYRSAGADQESNGPSSEL